jgi:hypothetical protein
VERSERAALISDVVAQYLQASLELVAAVERCAAKGWPDRMTELRAATRTQQLLCDRELARLKYALATDSDATLESYTRIGFILRRLRDEWTSHDEQALREREPAYIAIETQIESMPRFDRELDEPLKMAQQDPEFHSALGRFNQAAQELDSLLDQRAS